MALVFEDLAIEHGPAFLAFVDDLRAGDVAWFKSHYGDSKKKWDETTFAAYVKKADVARLDWRPKAGKTSVSRYVLRETGGAIVASGWLQFPLTKETELDGGNLQCDVAPSLRRRGYGSHCLSLMLFEAVRAGLRRALVTCAADDVGARRMIELNRGILQDVIGSTARFWISFS